MRSGDSVRSGEGTSASPNFAWSCRARALEEVTFAAHGEDDLRLVAGVAELLAQPDHVHVDGARTDVVRRQAPHLRQQLLTRHRAAAVLGEVAEEGDLALG